MSKAVSKVGRAIGKVVNGAVSGVKKFAKSKFGKVIIGAALVYFGGAALAGAMGTGTTAMGGLQAAWSGLAQGSLTGMTSAFTTGAAPGVASGMGSVATGVMADSLAPVAAGVGEAGSFAPMLATGAEAGASSAVGGGLNAAGSQFASTVGSGLQTGSVLPAGVAPAAAKAGMWQTMLTSPHTMPAVINAGGTMMSALGNSKAQEEMWNRQQQLTDEERARYSRNIGSTVNFQQPRRG